MPKTGQLIMLVSPRGKRYMRFFDCKEQWHFTEGIVTGEDVKKAGFGGVVYTHRGIAYRVVRPTLHDLILYGIKRQTQILYPKEIGYLLIKLGIGSGSRVIEAGGGSGGFTVALSHAVGKEGKVYSYERRPEFLALARRNLTRCGLGENVEQLEHDVSQGFLQNNVDGLFLDVRDPWNHVHNVAKALRPGAPAAFLVPVVNQASQLLEALESAPFDDVEMVEVFIRNWKTVPDRLRPADKMVAHTGFLLFARHQEPLPVTEQKLGTRERKQQAAKQARQSIDIVQTSSE